MPSRQTFSVQSLISIWNNQNRGRFQIQQNDDIWSVAENVLSSLPLRIQPNRSPIFTRFSAFITCSCGRTANEDVPDSQLFRSVPLLQIPEQDQPVSFGSLVNTLLQTPVNTRCRYCNGEANGSLETVKYAMSSVLSFLWLGFALNALAHLIWSLVLRLPSLHSSTEIFFPRHGWRPSWCRRKKEFVTLLRY